MTAYVLHQLLAESASRRPDQFAVRFGDTHLTYRELDALSDRVAALLYSNGVRRGDRVGLLLHKSAASISSIFAVLKTGAAYVPLDPNAPARRLAYVAQDCSLRVLLVGADLIPRALEMSELGAPIDTAVVMDRRAGTPAHALPFRVLAPEDAPVRGIGDVGAIESDLAYILYTSGSTGQPKGVMISHRNSLTFVDWATAMYAVGPDDVLSNHAPLHFDLSIFDIFAGVKGGATIAPVPEGMSTFPIRLAQWIADNRITTWYSVPSALMMLLNHGSLARWDLTALRTILFAGEVFPTRYLRQLLEVVPGPRYANLYGPTETNVITAFEVETLDPERVEPIPIGKACSNMDVFALDEHGQVVNQSGVEGELYGRGSCVALGYWGQPEKTAQLFVQNPLHDDYGDRVYRTGDIVTLDYAGNYLYRGRRDHMVKSRGYRIELGDIEAALYSHPGVKEAAVVAVPDELIGHALQAYVVAAERDELVAKDLQTHCRARLPGYMVPEQVVIRDGLPRTSNGKVDRVQLTREAVEMAGVLLGSH
jgi:amino acid adenylation domain-containing protein